MDFKHNCFEIFDHFHSNFPHRTRWHVAFSGGLDSTALLSLLYQWKQDKKSIEIDCIHVHHGLSIYANQWETHCVQWCQQFATPCQVEKVNVSPLGSIEANARMARYEALRKYIQNSQDVLLTAHHQDDQAETLLLQLLRGAGLKGLSAMPSITEFAQGILFRPLLSVNRAQLEAYAREYGLSWMDDDSNTHLDFDRNFLRANVIPLLQQRWPAMTKTVSRAAHHLAESQSFLTQALTQYYEQVKTDDPAILLIEPLKNFSMSVQGFILRYWFEQMKVIMPNQAVMSEIHKSMIESKCDANPHVHWGNVDLYRYQERLYCVVGKIQATHQSIMTWDFHCPIEIPGVGILKAINCKKNGLKPPPKGVVVTIQFRKSGEKIQLHRRKGHHMLKKLFQEWGVPPWRRHVIPLVYYDEELVCVVGHGIAQDWADEEGGYLLECEREKKIDKQFICNYNKK